MIAENIPMRTVFGIENDFFACRIARLRALLNEALKKVEMLTSEQSKQNLVIAEMKKQRDIYKSVCETKKSEEEVCMQ